MMPAVALGWSTAGVIARLAVEPLGCDAERLYQNREGEGLSEVQIVVCHALKNALLPVVTVGHPGGELPLRRGYNRRRLRHSRLGRLAVDAIRTRDMPLLGSVLFATFLVVMGNAVADILYSTLDPRIRYGR